MIAMISNLPPLRLVSKPKVAVIGAGPGGIAMGIQFRRGHDFTIFDRSDGFGGTWRNNTYPGAAAMCLRTSTPTRSR